MFGSIETTPRAVLTKIRHEYILENDELNKHQCTTQHPYVKEDLRQKKRIANNELTHSKAFLLKIF